MEIENQNQIEQPNQTNSNQSNDTNNLNTTNYINPNTFLTSDDIEYLETMEKSEMQYIQEMQNQHQLLDTMIASYDQQHILSLPEKHYQPRQTIVRKTEDQLRQEIQSELDAKISIERQRQTMLETEIYELNQRIEEYNQSIERMKYNLELERSQEQENNALMEQFGIEIETERMKNEGDVVILKIRFEKMRKYNSGYLELKVEKGIIHIQRCQPEVKEVERLLEQFYHHHNFMIFLLNVRNCFKA